MGREEKVEGKDKERKERKKVIAEIVRGLLQLQKFRWPLAGREDRKKGFRGDALLL